MPIGPTLLCPNGNERSVITSNISSCYQKEDRLMTDVTKNTLELRPLVNFRDLGGLPVIGGHVKPHLVARADDLSFIDEEGARAIIDCGANLILDLRSSQEATHTGRGPLRASDVTYLHQPLTDNVAMRGAGIFENIVSGNIDPAQSAELMGQWYASLVETQGENIRIGLQAIADNDGATIFHCVAGKDRTGIFAASLLSPGCQG